MESTTPNSTPDNNNKNTNTDSITSSSSAIEHVHESDFVHSDSDSHTEGKPSPPPLTSLSQPAIHNAQSPSNSTDRSASPTRSKKRAIDTMLDGDEDKECIVLEKQQSSGPPLPKRQSPPTPAKIKAPSPPSPPSPASSFMDHPLYSLGDPNYEQALKLLEVYRLHDGILENGAPILDFFDKWIKDIRPNLIVIADALFDMLLQEPNPTIDERLVARIPLVMNQILQRKRKETVPQLFRVTYLAVQLSLAQLPEMNAASDHTKIKSAFDFLKMLNQFVLQFVSCSPPRAFQGYAFDKHPYGEKLAAFRFTVLGHYCQVTVFERFAKIVRDYAGLDRTAHSILSMMTLAGEVASQIFRCYKQLKAVAKLKERLTLLDPNIDLNANFEKISKTVREMGKFIYAYLVKLIRTEWNCSVLSVGQLTMTTSFLRTLALSVGPLDQDEVINPSATVAVIPAMQMTARLAFEGFTTETKRRDILDWTVNWVKRQLELDYGKTYKNVHESEAVGQSGIIYIGELVRDRKILHYLTVDRIHPSTLQVGLLFFLFSLKNINALTPDDLNALYTRFVAETDEEPYWRAYWEGLRAVILNLDTDPLRTAILTQIQETEWHKLYFPTELHPMAITQILGSIVDSVKENTTNSNAPIPGFDIMPIVRTIQTLLRGFFVHDIEDPHFRSHLTDILLRLFPYYPCTGEERAQLAQHFFEHASSGPMNQRCGDLTLLRALLLTDTSEFVTGWKRDEVIAHFCAMKPSLPEIILGELAGWKQRQYQLGYEGADRSGQIQFRVQFLMHILQADKNVGGEYTFPRDVLEEFWRIALMRYGDDGSDQYWGGDGVTETMRVVLLHILAQTEFRRHSGLDATFLRFFLDEKLPTVSMVALKPHGWDFIFKSLEVLDSQMTVEYIPVPIPLLWKVIRESYVCAGHAMKVMTARLLRVPSMNTKLMQPNVPMSVHQEFVESSINEIVEIGNRPRKSFDGRITHQDYCAFKATLDTLGLFLNDYKKSVHEKADDETTSASTEIMEVDGDKRIIVARCHQTPGPKDYRDIPFSPEVTIKEFHETLAAKLCLVRFRTFAQGREITRKEFDQSKTLQEWGLKDLEAIMIQVQERVKEEPAVKKISPCEQWVLTRFNDLHKLLSGESRTAYLISMFLIQRPHPSAFVDRLRNPDTPWEEMFSSVFPWDMHYALMVLHECVEQYKQGVPEFRWVGEFGEKHHARIVELVEWFSHPRMADTPEWPFCVIYAVCILVGFIQKDFGSFWIQSLPVERLIKAMLNLLRFQSSRNTFLVTPVMDILSGLSSIDGRLWLKLVGHEFQELFFAAAVAQLDESARESAWAAMLTFFEKRCQIAFQVSNGTNEQSDSDPETRMEIDPQPDVEREIVFFIWEVTLNCMKKANAYIPLAKKAFDTGASMLRVYYRSLSAINADEANDLLRGVLEISRKELFDHTVQESVLDNTAIDYYTLGWTRVLQAVLDLLSTEKIDALMPRNFPRNIIMTFLFPQLPSDRVENAPPMKPYCIHSETRSALFDLVFKLLDTPVKRNVIASFVSSILDADSDIFPDDHYIDRQAWVQASSRLSGIHNLSNTCYMNSLINQLFMNVDFRNFMFNVKVDDPKGSQSLLHQLQFLFARLQLGIDKAAYPQELAHSIIDFEGLPINIHVQMDVDEFFNLLFDRIENQIKNVEERLKFRRLYGGVYCHTIKSRECPHVSSREEDFVAIQCDVRGKRNLEESLASYVEGEMMDGDNKYSCEACGRHVDAVKQISIKSLPDNLIFHLKRFEYAFDIGKRIKVNDHFEFPKEIDLFPYTLGNIEMQEKGAKQPMAETRLIYDLVGVLVHTGTAESGHYYSYIRDPRPREVVPDPKVSWFEFNDSEVKPWRIEELDHWCFGGSETPYDPAYFSEAQIKSYSAYMLFYRKRPKPGMQKVPLEMKPPPADLKAQVQRYNDDFVRRYVIYGEDLIAFVAKLLRSIPRSETNRLEDCEMQSLDDHIQDLYPLVLGLQVYRLIVSRMEFRSSVEKFCAVLKSAVRSSPAARHYFYTWLQKTPGVLKELLLTNINEKARLQSAQLIASSLTGDEVAKPRTLNPGNGVDVLDVEAVRNVVTDIANLVYSAGDNWRSWSEYFETLVMIARDPEWARLLIEENMIANCLYHFVHLYVPRRTPPRGFGRLKYPDNERVRPNYKKLISLVAQLIPQVIATPGNPLEDRGFTSLDEPGWISDEEFDMIFLDVESEYSTRRHMINAFVYRLFETSCDVGDESIIVTWMLRETILRDDMNPQKGAIVNALNRQADPTHVNAAEALDVVWKLVDEDTLEDEEDVARWRQLLLHIIKRVAAMWSDYLRESYYGVEYLSFWKYVYDYDDEDFRAIVLMYLPQIACQLLYSNESGVRDRTSVWLQSLIPKLAEYDGAEAITLNCVSMMFHKLIAQTEQFLDRKFIITERVASIQSVVSPVLQILRLISISFAIVSDRADAIIESLQERTKVMQELQDNNYYYGDGSDDDMEELSMTDDDESIADGSPYA